MFFHGTSQIKFDKPDDTAYHVYAGMVISATSGGLIYWKTKKPFISCGLGFLIGTAAGFAKEYIWDRQWGLGVCNPRGDIPPTIWGSAVGSFSLRIGIGVHEQKQLDKEYYQHLGDSLRLDRIYRLDTLTIPDHFKD